MKLGTVTGKVTIQRREDCMQGKTVLVVQTDGGSLAALDRAGARPGDRVLVAEGTAAERFSMDVPADAVVVAVVTE